MFPLLPIEALREVAGDLAPCRVGRHFAAENGLQRLETWALECGFAVGRSARNHWLFCSAQLIVWAWRSVMTSVADVFSPLLTLAPPSGAVSTSRFCRITRDDARLMPPEVLMDMFDDVHAIAVRDGAGEKLSRIAADGDRPFLARELGKNAGLRDRPELAERDLLALLDRSRCDKRGERRAADDGAWHDDSPRDGLALQVAAAGDLEPVVPAGMSRVATRTFTRPAPLLTLLR